MKLPKSTLTLNPTRARTRDSRMPVCIRIHHENTTRYFSAIHNQDGEYDFNFYSRKEFDQIAHRPKNPQEKRLQLIWNTAINRANEILLGYNFSSPFSFEDFEVRFCGVSKRTTTLFQDWADWIEHKSMFVSASTASQYVTAFNHIQLSIPN